MKLVLDTNVVMDWLVFEDASLTLMRFALLSGHLTIVTHEMAANELRRVLNYPALKLDATRQEDVYTRYRAQTSLSDVSTDLTALPVGFPRCRDPDDNPFIALAWNARADALVSKDKAVLKVARKSRKFGFRILSVPQMNAALAQLATS